MPRAPRYYDQLADNAPTEERYTTTKSADRRPWLILSRREVRALLDALDNSVRTPDLERALRVIGLQEAWIDGRLPSMRPMVQGTPER